MAQFFVVTKANGILYSSSLHYYSGATSKEITLPAGVAVSNIRPSVVTFRNRTYIVGTYTPGIVITEDLTAHKMGINPPEKIPSISVGAGAIVNIGYLTAVHKENGAVVHESNPGGATTSVTGDVTRSWTGIPSTFQDARVTHVRGYVKIDSGSKRFAWERTVGVTTVSESVATLSLGAVLVETRGVPPKAKFIAMYHERLWYAGDPDNPDRVYYSEVGEPEAVQSTSFIRTKNREAVTGLAVRGDELIAFTYNTTQSIQGYTATDFQSRILSPSIGCISHYGIVNINDRLWFPSQMGIYVYDGGFTYVTQSNREFWRSEYESNKQAYEDGFGVDDRIYSCYVYSVEKGSAPKTFKWVGYYVPFEPAVGGTGAQPWWFFDKRDRKDTAAGLLAVDGTARYRRYSGSDDGYVREENIETNVNDDSDTFNKALTITTKHMLMDDPGGDQQEGKTFTRCWSYVEAENNAWILGFFGGDETAINQAAANFTDNVAASVVSGKVAKTVHHHPPMEAVRGRGLTLKYTASSPNQMIWRGFGLVWAPGPAYRGSS